MHVGDLDGSYTEVRKFWKATVDIAVHDDSHNPVANATVDGSWSGSYGSGSCLTDASGQCSVSSDKLDNADNSVSFTVDGVTHASLTYEPADNHDPDGPSDSDGTTITISKGAVNQPPVASFTYSCPDMTCYFTGTASHDPDGTIDSYLWDFGDGHTDNGETTSHPYGDPDTYTVVLEVTDNGGAKDTDTQEVPVGVTPPEMFVFAIDMSGKAAGPNRSATAVVTIYQVGDTPVAGATVSGFWSGAYEGTVSGVTDAEGKVTFTSGRVRDPGTVTFTFTVGGVVKSGYVYDETLNNEDSDSIPVG
jgi:PKD repeat protein